MAGQYILVVHLQVVHGILQLVLDVIHRADELQDGLVAQGVLPLGLIFHAKHTQTNELQAGGSRKPDSLICSNSSGTQARATSSALLTVNLPIPLS
jgi:hypothetical protein